MIDILIKAVVAGTPLLLAAMGETITERSGVLNLGIEGAFVAGAAAAFVSTVLTENVIIGLMMGGVIGSIIGFVHSIISISFRGNQIVSGLALTMIGYGFASLVGRGLVGVPLPTYISSEQYWIYIFLIEIIVSILLWYIIFRLKIGIILRSAGEQPHAAEALGVDVIKTRFLATILGSILMGLGGAWYTLGYVHIWTEGLGSGRGWISLAIVIVSGWNPVLIPIFSFLFGGIEAAIWRLQLPPLNYDPYILGMFPYVATLISLVVFMVTPLKHIFRPPRALAQIYFKEERTV